jgi:hypothetical protein
MSCYYQGCSRPGTDKEHIPPKSFFPKDQRNQLLTVRSCELHNNKKSSDDTYVLAQICMNASPSNRSREAWKQSVLPQLDYNDQAFRKTLAGDAIPLPSGAVMYKVDTARFDRFFNALSCGIVFKACGERLPAQHSIEHVYHNFLDPGETPKEKEFKNHLLSFYSGEPMAVLDFGRVRALNTSVYSVKVFGIPRFRSSITIVHDFFGVFRVTSMLTRQINHPRLHV